jgi:hypothetical protein
MINNAITIAEHKLKMHFENGENTSLSILEVAELMDLITFGHTTTKPLNTSIFFSFSQN